MTSEPQHQLTNKGETGRIEAFSDGVFAIAITLLILDIKVPQLTEGESLLPALAKEWPAYFAFVTSFATIGIMWINHHRLFTLIKRLDQMLLVLNGLLLLGVTVVPFPTALLGAYIQHSQGYVAALIYSGTFIVTALLFNLLWWYAARKGRLLDQQAEAQAVQTITRQYGWGPWLYGAAFVLAPVSVLASIALNLLLAIFFALPGKRSH